MMTKEEYNQEVAAMIDDETKALTPLYNDPFPVSVGPSKHDRIREQRAFFSSQRMSIKKQLAAIEAKRKAFHQKEYEEIEAWQASVSFEGAKLFEELEKFTTVAKERTELRLRMLDYEQRALQGRLNLLSHSDRDPVLLSVDVWRRGVYTAKDNRPALDFMRKYQQCVLYPHLAV
jgi:hypothetical protein